MGVGEDHCSGVLFERLFDDLTRMNGCAVDRTSEHLFIADKSMALVEKEYGEDFVFEVPQFEGEIVASRFGTGKIWYRAGRGGSFVGRLRSGFPRKKPLAYPSRCFHH